MIPIDESLISFYREQISILEKLSNDLTIKKIIEKLISARNNNSRIFIMGNGGSGSTASHFTSDLLKTAITENENRFSAFSLVDNIPVILAWSNDVSYDDIFVEQLKNHLKQNDILVGFSGSGKSKNLLKAFDYAKNHGAICIGFSGMSGGEFPKLTNLCHITPSNDMLIIEATHTIIFHCIISSIRNLGKPTFTYE